jgi:hypothetical protein
VVDNASTGTIQNCYVETDVSALASAGGGKYTSGVNAAGFCFENAGKIYNSCHVGTVAAESATVALTGGLVARNMKGATIQNVYNAGNIPDENMNGGTMSDLKYIGSVVGNNLGILSSAYCSDEDGGSIAGQQGGTVSNTEVLSETAMMKSAFAKKLNANRGSNKDWLKWVFEDGAQYPSLVELNEVTFATTRNGVVRSTKSYAYAGQTVQISASAYKNYKFASLSVKTKSGKSVKLTKVRTAVYKFTMPDGEVVVSAKFKKK